MQSKISSKKLCKWVQQRFSEYVDGVLPEKERLEIHRHLHFCRVCGQELDLLCKTLSMLADSREECLLSAIQTYRLPRSTFMDIFPSIREEKHFFTVSTLVPYLTALILFFLAISTWDFAERLVFEQYFNDSNYVEVIGKV